MTKLDGLEHATAISHAWCQPITDGFRLWANWKQADVAFMTVGENVYGHVPKEVTEHYSGSIIEPFDVGGMARIEKTPGSLTIDSTEVPYDPTHTSKGHTWLPINIEVSPDGERLYATAGGVQPRLIGKRVASNHPSIRTDYEQLRYVPSVLARYDPTTLELDRSSQRRPLTYAEAVASTVATDPSGTDWVITFSVENGLRIYRGERLGEIVASGVNARLMHVDDHYFRSEPAHLEFIRYAA